MEKYAKLFKGLEMCAKPDCNPECPYHGETRGGKTCRSWLLNDAAAALATEEGLAATKQDEADAYKREVCEIRHVRDAFSAECIELRAENEILRRELETAKKSAPVACGVLDSAEDVVKFNAEAAYWHGQADALKWCMELAMVEDNGLDLPDMHGEPEPEADDHV